VKNRHGFRAGTVDNVVRTAFRLRWLPRHVLALVLIAALILLGRWQWDVSEAQRGGLQNLLYAFQWWAMAGMVVYGWWRLLRDDAYGRPAARATPTRSARSAAEAEWDFPQFDQGDAFASLTPQTSDDRDPDPELADYNDYLTRLNARSERAR
jgi:DNA-binding transcriptional regulator of glucitol operon